MMQKSAFDTVAEKCVSLKDLHLETLRFDQEVYDRCGRFIIRLLHDKTGEEDQMEQFSQSQAKIKTLTRKLNRRKAFADWDYGQMHPLGSWQPPRGRPGDGYAPYPTSEVLTQEDIRTLFAHASDIECLLAYLEPHALSVVKELKELGKQVNVLGHYGVTAYHCWNYIAPEHLDNDATSTVSYQLKKMGCKDDEFNFSFAKWGKVLETKENCIWWFKGDQLHGTVAPHASTLCNGNCLSQGVGITVPHRTLDMAKKYVQARWGWKPLCERWKVFT
ncbi:hypothetical protein J3R82DRAFT_3379 [Butyriboletus roseoflavus]|nr:hypothetical protein J3R82DRAFT_3379 [Butyriboletus roseoflavus]